MNATPAPPRPVDLSAPLFGLDRRGLAWVEETLAGLTREQKVGQLLCLYLRGDDMARFTSDLDGMGVAPGAVMMLPRSPTAAARDVAALQGWSRIPLLVAGNLESGAVNFLTGVEAFANPMQVAAAGDEAAVDALADHCIRVARSLGMNWAFAPVVDVAVNPANPITNTRSFGADHELVARLGSRYVARLERAGLMTSPKHFPGDGVDDRDQHLVTSSNDLDLDEWTRTFGAVYSAVIAAGARSIMVGHIRQRALSKSVRPGLSDADVRPGSLAAELIGDVLRGRLGFEGLVVSDNTAMAGFTTAGRRDRTLPEMVAAGVDVVLGNVDVAADFAALVQAVDILTDDRLDEAVRRVLATKASLGLHLSPFVAGFGEPAFDHPDDLEARRVLARRSITVTKDAANLLPLRAAERRRVLVVVVGDEPTFYDPSGPFAPHFVAVCARAAARWKCVGRPSRSRPRPKWTRSTSASTSRTSDSWGTPTACGSRGRRGRGRTRRGIRPPSRPCWCRSPTRTCCRTWRWCAPRSTATRRRPRRWMPPWKCCSARSNRGA